MSATQRVRAAIAASQQFAPEYWGNCLAQRAGDSETAAGSIYPDLSGPDIEWWLLEAEWEEYAHPAILPGCTGFSAVLAGQLGVAPLASLAPDQPVVLDDRKGTGKVSATVTGVRGQIVPLTVLIVGPGEEEGQPEYVWTFHPGDPVRPSQVPAEGMHGRQITAAEAISLGLETAKIV
ncbi:MAG: hypothetical protein EPO02_09375 [Nitrospirae bacterium]|nr:MAG: hypothetical protein EPO02_09375 [Nitrospirota bacterium]